MTKFDLLYVKLIEQLSALTDAGIADGAIPDTSDVDGFLMRIEILQRQCDALKMSYSIPEYCDVEEPIFNTLCEILAIFPHFQPERVRQIYIMLLWYAALSEADTTTWTNPSAELFQLLPSAVDVSAVLFVYWNQSSPVDSIAYIDIRDLALVCDEIKDSNTSTELVIQLIHVIGKQQVLTADRYVVVKAGITPSQNDISSFVKLRMLMSGAETHRTELYHNPPTLLNGDAAKLDFGYHQFKEQLDVLGEYVYAKDLLFKVLTLYHVFESFMYRTRIVQLQRGRLGRMLSIRDFKRLYGQVVGGESEKLCDLLEDVLGLTLAPATTTIASKVRGRWSALVGTEVDAALNHLSVMTSKGVLITHQKVIDFPDNLHIYLGHIVYRTRNCIVHNTETEVHLTHAGLPGDVKKFFNVFLIPVMEEIVFHLISTRNDVVWYEHPHLVLYET